MLDCSGLSGVGSVWNIRFLVKIRKFLGKSRLVVYFVFFFYWKVRLGWGRTEIFC